MREEGEVVEVPKRCKKCKVPLYPKESPLSRKEGYL